MSFQILCPLALYCHRHFYKIVVSEFELEEQIIWNKSYASNKLIVFFFFFSIRLQPLTILTFLLISCFREKYNVPFLFTHKIMGWLPKLSYFSKEVDTSGGALKFRTFKMSKSLVNETLPKSLYDFQNTDF